MNQSWVERRLTEDELKENRSVVAKIVKRVHGRLISELQECVELKTTLRQLADMLENNEFTKEEKAALYRCFLNIDGKEKFNFKTKAF